MEKIDNTLVGARLRIARGTMHQADFADKIGIGRSSIVRYEAGERTLDIHVLEALYRELKVDPLWLLYGEATRLVATVPADAQALLGHLYNLDAKDRKRFCAEVAALSANATRARGYGMGVPNARFLDPAPSDTPAQQAVQVTGILAGGNANNNTVTINHAPAPKQAPANSGTKKRSTQKKV